MVAVKVKWAAGVAVPAYWNENGTIAVRPAGAVVCGPGMTPASRVGWRNTTSKVFQWGSSAQMYSKCWPDFTVCALVMLPSQSTASWGLGDPPLAQSRAPTTGR